VNTLNYNPKRGPQTEAPFYGNPSRGTNEETFHRTTIQATPSRGLPTVDPFRMDTFTEPSSRGHQPEGLPRPVYATPYSGPIAMDYFQDTPSREPLHRTHKIWPHTRKPVMGHHPVDTFQERPTSRPLPADHIHGTTTDPALAALQINPSRGHPSDTSPQGTRRENPLKGNCTRRTPSRGTHTRTPTTGTPKGGPLRG
jgi:hypothetical protein